MLIARHLFFGIRAKHVENMGAGATFDLTFFDNSKLINFDD